MLDEPSIGMHPANLKGLLGVMDDLVDDGNSVVLVDHDTQVLRHADYMIELGPGAGKEGGSVIARGGIGEIEADPHSQIGAYLSGEKEVRVRERCADVFANGRIHLSTNAVHTVHPLEVDIPRGRLSVVTAESPVRGRRPWCWNACFPRCRPASPALRFLPRSAPSRRRAYIGLT